MSDFLSRLADRFQGVAPLVRPRQRSRFESEVPVDDLPAANEPPAAVEAVRRPEPPTGAGADQPSAFARPGSSDSAREPAPSAAAEPEVHVHEVAVEEAVADRRRTPARRRIRGEPAAVESASRGREVTAPDQPAKPIGRQTPEPPMAAPAMAATMSPDVPVAAPRGRRPSPRPETAAVRSQTISPLLRPPEGELTAAVPARRQASAPEGVGADPAPVPETPILAVPPVLAVAPIAATSPGAVVPDRRQAAAPAASEPIVKVKIGRVDVRAMTPPAPAQSRRPAGPKLTLGDYLEARNERRR